MSSDSAQPLSHAISSAPGYSYLPANEEIQVIDFKINSHNGSTVNLMTLANSVHALVRNQEILVNSINILFQNQKVMMDTIAEIREWKMKCSTPPPINSDSCKEEKINLPQMPLTNLKEFLLFDHELRKNEILRKKLAKKISNIKGSTFEKTIRAIIKSIMTDELCTQITWSGIRKTVSMYDKKIPEIIFSALHREPPFGNYKLKNVENVVKAWLQQARSRLRSGGTQKIQKALRYERNRLRKKELLESDSKDLKQSNLNSNML